MLAATTDTCQRCHVNTARERHGPGPGPWTFLTNHGHVLLCLAAEPGIRVQDLAARVGLSERAALRILHDLVEAGYVERRREGRRTHYPVRLDRPMRHAVERAIPVARLVDALRDAWTAYPTDLEGEANDTDRLTEP
jgi:DNA-binding MarR family transcriptional regulator